MRARIYDQIIFAEYTHEPAEELARGLVDIAPAGLAHVFYSDSGSTCVEVALKMALGFFHNSGAPRCRICRHGTWLSRRYDRHDVGGRTRRLQRRPMSRCCSASIVCRFPAPGREQETLDAFETFCASGQVAALLIEPLILGAGGMRMYPAWF